MVLLKSYYFDTIFCKIIFNIYRKICDLLDYPMIPQDYKDFQSATLNQFAKILHNFNDLSLIFL